MSTVTNRLGDLFDAYSLRARLYPALLTALPLLPCALLFSQADGVGGSPARWIELSWPVLVVAGLPFLATNFVRSRGKAAQTRLLSAWDGFPTTRMLRHRDPGPPELRTHRRRRLEERLGITLPTADEEVRDPKAADHQYSLAVLQLIARVRARDGDFMLVGEENAAYGFRRNLYGMKVPALVVLALSLVADVATAAGALPYGELPTSLMVPLGSGHAAAAIFWLTIVRSPWVKEAAEDYATRLLAALDDPRQ